MTGVHLPPLIARSPLGFLAGLGALDVADRQAPECRPRLSWTEGLLPHAVIDGPASIEQLVGWVEADLEGWRRSTLLSWPSPEHPEPDLKPEPAALHGWIGAMAEELTPDDRADSDLLVALMAEGAIAGKGNSKPTHLHFTAGQQLFLDMVREIRARMTRDDLMEALQGPWRDESTYPVLGWDVRGERIHALRGFAPSGEKRTGTPGADWLAFLGLRYFPVAVRGEALLTSGCDREWKRGRFRWPVWPMPLTAPVVRSLLCTDLASDSSAMLNRRGISHVFEAPIRRADQGGYGSFGAPVVIAGRAAPSR